MRGPIASPVAVYTATYDAVGNRLAVQELDGTRVTYSYDPSYQLTREQRSGANAIDQNFVYDGVGNRLTKTDATGVTTYTYNTANELLSTVAPTSVVTTRSYDANGNVTQDTGAWLVYYTWDAEDRLLWASGGGYNETNTYLANGKRFSRLMNGNTQRYIWDGENVRGEQNLDGNMQAIHEDLPGIWGGKFTEYSGGAHFYVPDFQGHTRFLLDSTGAITDTLVPNAWGEELVRTGTTYGHFLCKDWVTGMPERP